MGDVQAQSVDKDQETEIAEHRALRLSRTAMACEFEVIVIDERDRSELVDIANLALDEIERLGVELSCFNPTSDISLLNAEAAHRSVMVGPDLFKILWTAKRVWSETGGAFDVTAGPLIDLWRAAERTGNPPDQVAIDRALCSVGMGNVLLDENTHSVRFLADGLEINLGAIGKGYAVRQAASILREYDVETALISGGGSTIQGFGPGPDGDGWHVGIRHPRKLDERVAELVLRDQAMSTSGGPAQRDRHVEETFEHIVDPVTGMSAESEAASVTVITDDAVMSDALATAFYLRGRAFADRYCSEHARIRTIFVSREDVVA